MSPDLQLFPSLVRGKRYRLKKYILDSGSLAGMTSRSATIKKPASPEGEEV
jgi:hypothetical protein